MVIYYIIDTIYYCFFLCKLYNIIGFSELQQNTFKILIRLAQIFVKFQILSLYINIKIYHRYMYIRTDHSCRPSNTFHMLKVIRSSLAVVLVTLMLIHTTRGRIRKPSGRGDRFELVSKNKLICSL